MKIYRVANVDFNVKGAEGNQLLESNMIRFNRRESGYKYPRGVTSFSKEQMDQGKFFFIDLMDAVKFSIFCFPKEKRSRNVIFSFDVPDAILLDYCGLGYYRTNNNLGPVLFADISNYFTLELLIPYDVLATYLSTGEVIDQGFKIPDGTKHFDNNSNMVQMVTDLLRLCGTEPYYIEELNNVLSMFGYDCYGDYGGKPFTNQFSLPQGTELTRLQRIQLYKNALKALSNTVTEDYFKQKTKRIRIKF